MKHISNFASYLIKNIGLLEYDNPLNILHRSLMANMNDNTIKLKYKYRKNKILLKPCTDNDYTSIRILNSFGNILDTYSIPNILIGDEWFEIDKKWLNEIL